MPLIGECLWKRVSGVHVAEVVGGSGLQRPGDLKSCLIRLILRGGAPERVSKPVMEAEHLNCSKAINSNRPWPV